MHKYSFFIASAILLSSCSTSKKTINKSNVVTDSIGIHKMDSIHVNKLEISAVDSSTTSTTTITNVEFDSTADYGYFEYQLPDSYFKSNTKIKSIRIEKKEVGSTKKKVDTKSSDSTAVVKQDSTHLKKKETIKSIEKQKTYAMPWYFWIIILFGGLLLLYLVLRKKKLL